MALNEFLGCPTACGATITLPALPADVYCTAYPQRKSQVASLFLTPSGAPDPFDTTTTAGTAAIVADSIDNSDTTAAKTKWIVGEGGIAAPESTTIQYPYNQTRSGDKTYTLTFNVKNMEEAMYNFLRQLQCGDTSWKIYYMTVGGWHFGGEDGIIISSIDVDFIYGEGVEDTEFATVTITYEADGDPERNAGPTPQEIIAAQP